MPFLRYRRDYLYEDDVDRREQKLLKFRERKTCVHNYRQKERR